MRFEEAYGGWEAGRLTQAEAASLSEVCERTFRRYLERCQSEGMKDLVDRRPRHLSCQVLGNKGFDYSLHGRKGAAAHGARLYL